MRVSEKRWAEYLENNRKRDAGEWFFTGWYRVVLADGSIWCETSSKSDFDEIVEDGEIVRPGLPKGAKVYKLMEKHKRKWVSDE